MADGINAAGLELVKRSEGLYLNAYTCPAGEWTIGYGHTGSVDGVPIRKGMNITKAKAEELLKADLAKAWKSVCDCPQSGQLNANQKAALCSFEFNLGKLWQICYIWKDNKKVRPRTVQEIGDALTLYCNIKGQPNNGLKKRRQEEQNLFFSRSAASAGVGLPVIRYGDKGDAVRALQRLLGGLTTDGDFGKRTLEAVNAFQAAHGLTVDGVVGPKTWAAILKA